jgi:signal transduction histidine kinase
MLAQLRAARDWLAARAADQPENFLHLLHLVDGERAWALGDPWAAASAFDAAVQAVEARHRPWHRALISERAGLFHLAHGLGHAGRRLLTDARDGYAAWGAAAKVARMQQEHEFLRDGPPRTQARGSMDNRRSVRGSSAFSSDALDMVGVLRASQALSSETSLERLSARVSEVLESLSGATKVLVLSWHDAQWWLLAAAPGEAAIAVADAVQRRLLPLSAFAYAERTGQALIVDDAVADDRFARDPYFAGVPLCALLVAPIASQGATRAMLVLENRQGRSAFNAQRLDAVMLIAGQLAVSLANVQLYESLEQRVQARTRELQRTQAELVATARRAGKAEIANNVLHNVGNVLNSINVSASVLRGTLANSRVEGLTRAVGLINEHREDLGRFVASDPRGQKLLAYLNELVQALRDERTRALDDLDRLARSVDHVTYVVTAQQSHAGPSSVVESTHAHEVLEEALRLSAQTLEQGAVTVIRRYEHVPAMALDKQRLLQILVNLIGNAAQAMESVPEQQRELTLGIAMAQEATGHRLRITVQDRGEGIAPENLTRIFSHGFTTRAEGHGFGLHSCALAALEMGGTLTAHSEGAAKGAVFTVELPVGLQERSS